MAINEKIYIGSVDTPTLVFDQNNIEDIVCNNSVDLIGDELSSDVLEIGVFFDDENEILRNVKYGTVIFYFSNDSLVGKYYINEVERTGINRYLIRSTSLIGLIEKEDYYGGYYSGQTFETVLNDILFTNGLNQSKYYLYEPAGSSGVRGVPAKVLNNAYSVLSWKYRIHAEFTLLGLRTPITTSGGNRGDYIAGDRDRYNISAWCYRDGDTDNYYYSITIRYSSTFYRLVDSGVKLIGTGSRVTVDINPLGGTYLISCDYVQYDDQTITGHIEKSGTIRPSTSTGSVQLGYVFGGVISGGSQVQYLYLNILWHSYKVFNEDGKIIIDAILAREANSTTNYIINKVNADLFQTTTFVPYGDTVGLLSDYDKRDRDEEIANSIEYGPGISALSVIGWIGRGTRREALHQLLFAENVCMLKTNDGKFLFTKVADSNGLPVQDANIYDDSKEKNINGAMTINVTEHLFEENSSSEATLFDNSSSALVDGTYVALFDNSPVYGVPTTTSELTIIAYNCNAALVKGRGRITGTPYTHSKNVIKYRNPDILDGADMSVSNIGLITSANSDNIMNKLKSYYSGNAKKITNSLIYNGEKCGVKYQFKTLYGNSNIAYLVKISAKSSSFVKAVCEFISGYVPPDIGGYSNYVIKTYDESWTVPADIRSGDYTNIRLNIIGKGHNGTSGGNGSAGRKGSSGSGALQGGEGGEGGTAGIGGDGGNIYSITIDVANINRISVSNSGYNTIVKTYNNSGSVVNTYSSSSGVASDSGFLNIFTGLYYGRKGKDGYPGGKGGKGGYVQSSNSITIIDPESGGSVENYNGGTSSRCIVKRFQNGYGGYWYSYSSYGGGGGAAYGNNGGNAVLQAEYAEDAYTVAGSGANAIVPQNVYTEYGSGGFGGHGGGGGGGAGTVTREEGESGGTYTTFYLGTGSYGTGSSGTPGIDGCVIVYY